MHLVHFLVLLAICCSAIFQDSVSQLCSLEVGCSLSYAILDRVVGQTSFKSGGDFVYDLCHRRKVASLCVLCKIVDRTYQPVRFFSNCDTSFVLGFQSRAMEKFHFRTKQLSRSFYSHGGIVE